MPNNHLIELEKGSIVTKNTQYSQLQGYTK